MKVIAEFDMVDMSMHKHETFFRHILKKYGFGIRSIKIIEPDVRKIEKESQYYTINENKVFNPNIDGDLMCTCGKSYEKHFYYEIGSNGWYSAWWPKNKCKEFIQK